MDSWQFTPYAIFYIIAAVIAFSLSAFVWRMKTVNGKGYFRYLTLFSGIWTLGYALSVFSANIEVKLIMLRVEYIGIISADIFWLFFVTSYTNSDNWLTKWMKGLILIIPILTFIQVLTFQYHNFYYLSYEFIEKNGMLITDIDYGPGFYIWIFYSYFILLTGGIILIRGILNMPEKFKRQAIYIIFVLAIILTTNILYIFGKNPIAPYDPTSLSFVLVGIAFFIIIHFDKFLNIVPIAYNLVFRSTKSGVIIINDNGIILDINPSAERIFNLNQKTVVGYNILDHFTEFNDVYDSILEDKDFRTELKFEKSESYFELITASLINSKKRVIGRILVFYDITMRKQALFELDAYARTVAHDLKSPMNSIKGFTQLITLEKSLNDEQNTYIQYIHDGVDKMNDIIEGLLLLARVRNKKDIETSPLEMGRIVDKVLYRLGSLIKQTNGKITHNNKWPIAIGYPIWVEEIWINYISNALKYAGDPPIVELGATEQKNSIQFWVKDNGKGLTTHETTDLFKEFSQLESKNGTRGHGLGLSIVKRIASKLGGTVGVDSKIGYGSTFYFTLPKK